MDIQQPRHKGFYILPNLFTTASMFSGFCGMLFAVEGNFEYCALAILISCLLDGMDGKVARFTNSASEFGVQLDSLADLVAFGVTPALMMYFWQTHSFNRLGLVTSFLLIACGALRLARFNVQAGKISKKFFIGLPIPAAASTLAMLVLFSPYFSDFMSQKVLPHLSLGLVFLVSILMVSNVRYASFKELGFIKGHRFTATVTALMLFALVVSQPRIFGFLLFIVYIISGLIYSYFYLPLRKSFPSQKTLKEQPSK